MNAPEEQLAAAVVAWLEGLGWEVYQEVQVGRSRRADLVAVEPVAPRRVWVIECKTSAGLDVVGQGCRWLGRAHLVSVAVPARRRRPLFDEVVAWKGLGALAVDARGRVSEVVAPRLMRRPRAKPLLGALRPEQRWLGRAGSARGGHCTPFKLTCLAVVEAVRRRPGLSLTDVVREVPTHYATPVVARACLVRWIREGVVRGIRVEADPARPRRLRLMLDEAG